MADIRLMLVDDSPLFLAAIKGAIANEPGMVLVGTAMNGEEALAMVPSAMPDVILCDVQMPRMDGIEFITKLMKVRKTPVVVTSSAPGVTLAALAAGAVDFIQKPTASEPKGPYFQRVVSFLRVAATANMRAKMAPARAPALPISGLLKPPPDVVIAIGASTGGTEAIVEVVKNLPPSTPGIVITQHMPAGFTAMYAQRLNKVCAMQVREVKEGDRLEQGLILLAAGGYHLRLRKDAQGYFATSRSEAKVSGHMPSVDVLFRSVAECAGARSVGIILTGMGADGAEGLLEMRGKGAYTLGQDEASSVVYGMPMQAYNIGAVQKQLPLGEIAGNMMGYLSRMR